MNQSKKLFEQSKQYIPGAVNSPMAYFVPILNMWVGFRCFACPAGYAYHKKMDGPGIVLAIFYWLMVLLSILIVIAFVALFFGTIDSPELQEQIREAIRSASKPAEQP